MTGEITPLDAVAIRRLGQDTWGSQDGLLSLAELRLLMDLVTLAPPARDAACLDVLEVGHYNGCSTCGLVHALRQRPKSQPWRLESVDNHQADGWVTQTDPRVFQANRKAHFDDPRLTARFASSQGLVAPLDYDVVFYDGDHAEEQRRFTQAVIDSPRVKLFIYDDRDFPVPATCSAMLQAHGWRDDSPEFFRAPPSPLTKYDKANGRTQTLAVFTRA